MALHDDADPEGHSRCCERSGCLAVALRESAKCLAHSDDELVVRALDTLRTLQAVATSEEIVLDASGVVFNETLLNKVLDCAQSRVGAAGEQVRRQLSKVSFEGATFPAETRFYRISFGPGITFKEAHFGLGCVFSDCEFIWGISFEGAEFGDRAGFLDGRFNGKAGFERATFGALTDFNTTAFLGEVSFEGAVFGSDCRFAKKTYFKTNAIFDKAKYGTGYVMDEIKVGDRASFNGGVFADGVKLKVVGGRTAGFQDAVFGAWAKLEVTVENTVTLQRAAFGQGTRIEVGGQEIDFSNARFPEGGFVQLTRGEVDLDSVACLRPTVWAGPADGGQLPILRRLHGCDLQYVVLADFDLRECRFVGAHNLDKLRLEGRTVFRSPPPPQVGWAFPPVWWWTPRRTLPEEHQWRAAGPGGQGSRVPLRNRGWWSGERQEVPSPAAVAHVYRALRKGREESKDEPGAADFYYGEMEMRRLDPGASGAARFVLWLYWLTSGYALRAGRALVLLLLVLLAAAMALAILDTASTSFWQGLSGAMLTTLEGALFRSAGQHLGEGARWILLVVRFVSPVLLGLAVLSVRGHVKR